MKPLAKKWVKQLRSELGLSVRGLAEKIDVTHTAIVAWESGSGVSPFNRMRLLALAQENRNLVGADVIEALEEAQPELLT